MRFLSGYALKKVFLIPCMKYRSKKDIPIPVEDPWNIPVAGEKLKLVGFLKTGDVCRSFGKGKMKMPLPVDTSGWGGISFQDSRLYVCPGDSGGAVISRLRSWRCMWGDNQISVYRPASCAYN